MLNPSSNLLPTLKKDDLNVQNRKSQHQEVHDLFAYEYVDRLLQAEEKHKKNRRLNPKKNIETQQFRYQSQVEKFLSLPFRQRTAKIIKTTKNIMRDFDCFGIEKNLTKGEKSSEIATTKIHEYQIIKRDIESLISIFAMYSEISYFQKGQIIDATGRKMQKIRILHKGDIVMYEPTNRTSFLNCIYKIKQKQTQDLPDLCSLYNDTVVKIGQNIFASKKTGPDSKQSQHFVGNTKFNFNEMPIAEILKTSNGQALTHEQCHQILSLCEIISPITPHKSISKISKEGYLLSTQSKPSILNQSIDIETPFTAICISNEVALIELDFAIYRELLWFFNDDQQKLYVGCLMKKFQSLSYFDAQKYLRKKQNIIDFIGQKNKHLYNTKAITKDHIQVNEIFSSNQENSFSQKIRQSLTIYNLEHFQNQSSFLFQTIAYTKTLYLIIKGEVRIVISKVKQHKMIDEKYSLPRKVYTRHQILKLYQNDFFGVQAIGEDSQFGLRYQVRKDSKILKINHKLLKRHIRTIPGFYQEFNTIKIHRDNVIEDILNNYSKQIQNQLVERYAEHSNQIKRKIYKTKQTKQIVHFERQKYEQSEYGTDIQTQGLKQIQFQQDPDSGRNLIKNRSSSLPNVVKKLNTQSVSETTYNLSHKSKKLAITKRKESQNTPRTSIIKDIEFIGNKQYPQLRKELLEKLSLNERKRYSTHNPKRLTVQLLKEFNMVEFKQQTKMMGSEKNQKYSFVEMRDPITGVLLRKRFIPSIQSIQGSKNRQKIEAAILIKIGLLSEAQRVKHNEKMIKNRKSGVEFENQDETKRKEQKRLLHFSKSLPKLENFYSKKADIQYRNAHNKKVPN